MNSGSITDVGGIRVGHHDLRHLFATICIESGVDIPTVSRWLGHQDGGALAMKTYGHLRDEHSIAQAKPARGVGHRGGLDLDHVGAQLGQDRGGHRSRDDHAERDYLDLGQRADGLRLRPFGDWAKGAWPSFSDAVLAEL